MIMRMIATIHSPAILHLSFSTQKDMILTMCRAAEFYECASSRLRNRVFTFDQWVEHYMTPDATLDYDWSGFNIPSRSLEQFFTRFDLTPREQQLRRATRKLAHAPYYVIASGEGDITTRRHEFAHAYFDLNPTYRRQATALVRELPITIRQSITKELRRWGYASQVMTDELNAYIATSGLRYLQRQFTGRITKKHTHAFVKLFNEVFIS